MRMLAVVGATVTVPTGTGVTVSAAVPDFPSLVAVIVTGPGATPVTTPVEDTFAMAVLLDVHVTRRSLATFPLTSRTVALNWMFAPTTTDWPWGCTVTDPTATLVTEIAAVPLLPSL